MFWKRWTSDAAPGLPNTGLPNAGLPNAGSVIPGPPNAGLVTAALLSAVLLAPLLLVRGTPVGAAEPPAVRGGDFTLDSLQGPVSLGDLRGKVVMLFFGYTSCPDICPISLSRIGTCLSSLDAEQVERVRGLFVTLDPGRDTPERMHRYAEFFHPGIIGLTGAREAIDEIAARYGVAWERRESPGSALGYSISHPDTVFLLDDDGNLVGEVGRDEGKEALRAKVLALLALRKG